MSCDARAVLALLRGVVAGAAVGGSAGCSCTGGPLGEATAVAVLLAVTVAPGSAVGRADAGGCSWFACCSARLGVRERPRGRRSVGAACCFVPRGMPNLWPW